MSSRERSAQHPSAGSGALPARLVLLAIDSLNLDFARAHLDRLPVLARLLATGTLRPLVSTAEVMSASVWPTFGLGAPPGEHGEYFPFQWDATTMSFRRTDQGPWAEDFRFEPFWFRLAQQGVPCIALDPAHVSPSRDVPCPQVVNWSYQSSGAAFSHPPELLRELRRRFGHRPIGAEVPVPKGRRRARAIRDTLVRATRAKGDAMLWLAETLPWRLFFAAMFEVHRAGHNLWPVEAEFASDAEPDALLAVCEETDRQVGRLLERWDDGETAFVLFALSGMEPNRAQDHFLPAILARLGAAWSNGGAAVAGSARGFNPMGLLRHAVPYGLQYQAARLLGEDIQDWVVNRALVGGLDWEKTPAFAVATGSEGYIRLNLRGRERDGCLTPEAAPAFVRWLESELLAIRVEETGEPLVAEVVHVQERFPGPKAHRLPDLCLRWAPQAPATRIVSPTIGEIVARLETGRGGNHTPDAFALFCGAAPGKNGLPEVHRIEELARFAEACLAPAESSVPALVAR